MSKKFNKNLSYQHLPSLNENSRLGSKNKSLFSNALDHPPVWQFKALDIDHEKWGWKNLKSQTVSVLNKLKSYESRLWKEIRADKKRDHPVPVTQLEEGTK